MTLKSDAKFEEKPTLGSKKGIKNLMNFNVSSGKSENLHFDVLLLSIAYKVSPKKVTKNYLMTLKSDPNLEQKLTFCLKNNLTSFGEFNASSGKSENLHFDGVFL